MTDRHPLRLEARIDAPLSRWMWLVKWFLALPHVVVLAFLWVGFVFATLAAFVARLFTGRYPRGLFGYTAGVLRWSWRVQAYAFGPLSTDRYPPFTLGEAPDYPARLELAYPEEPGRRGLPLIGWWLIGIPQYVIAGIIAGGWGAHVSVLSVLVLVAMVLLLVEGAYRPALFDLIMGFNRWALRTTAYAAFMTDVYPPFRLDTGGAEPSGAAPADVPPGTAPA